MENIREYENSTLKVTQSLAEKRLEYSTAKSKLENMISFDTQKLTDTEERISKTNSTIKKWMTAKTQVIEEIDNINHIFSLIQIDCDSIQKQMDETLELCRDQAAELEVVKKKLEEYKIEAENISKTKNKKAFQIEKLNAEKVVLLRKCKVEEIYIPVTSEYGLDDLSLDVLDVFINNVGWS